MGKRISKRPYRLIGFKAYFDGDQAIIDWWENIDDGNRSGAIRELLRQALGLQPERAKAPFAALPEIFELQKDTRWIRQALNDMPSYFEELVSHVATFQPVPQQAAVPAAVVNDATPLNSAESQRRARKLKRVSW